MNTFIRVAEVWVPSADGTLLEWGGGAYGALPGFGAMSRRLCFGRAEGLPGHAWDESRPIVLRQFEGSYFRRTAAAREAGLTCAVALPVFLGPRLTSVVVLMCGEPAESAGAIELWHNDPRVSADMTLDEGVFGRGGEELEDLSRDAYLPRGVGLPGLAWQREQAVFMDRIDDPARFLRAQTAARAGIVRALALPCATPSSHGWVLSLLSSESAPIARRIESWLPDDTGGVLVRAFGHCTRAGSLPAGTAGSATSIAIGRGPVGQACATATATVQEPLADPPEGAGDVRAVVAIPLVSGTAVSEVLALYF